MRRHCRLWMLIVASPAAAEHVHDDGCLEHHWAHGEYIGEIHYQLALIGAAAIVLLACRFIARFRRMRQCG